MVRTLLSAKKGSWYLTVQRIGPKLRARAVQVADGRVVRKLGGEREARDCEAAALMEQLREAIRHA
jgi:hypothetical protein